MRVKVSYRGQIKELEFEKDKITALELLKALGLSREYAFVVKGEEILEERDLIEDGEEVRVINAISGG
ncbi:MAG: MoaD/ThiS family protein [Aquificota bacterium]|jgi:sulfur carrier protein|nr:thiamine biosynthesis protein ThiS [Aquificaceae bacterium]MDM7267190.1 thiamine biosynthesis protein ThiS [Aquificaceae bacterium]QWK12892.1 MAG: thiamine biosynthesis protein ThiS [Aquificota bacterium]HAV40686.1 thiamine biosynthesis protein ThiS [Aquificaceae bacterium]HCO38663.1 thiamine biosynthesis protein ThiS [Aquificaceae bacterium]